MTGQRFGMLEVIEFAGVSPGKARMAKWRCRCDCGNEVTVFGSALRRKNGTDSCGCKKGEKIAQINTVHGMHGTPTYISWKSMVGRCRNPNSPDYAEYGGRGIKVCERWTVFESFLADMGERPDGTTLERSDTDGNYEPGNCRWATPLDQANNRRSNRKVVFRGEEITISGFARSIGIDKRKARHLLVDRGLTVDQVAEVTKRGGLSTVDGALSV